MTVKKLIALLSMFDPESPVFTVNENIDGCGHDEVQPLTSVSEETVMARRDQSTLESKFGIVLR